MGNQTFSKLGIILSMVLCALAARGCASRPGVQSQWLNRSIAIDGEDSEWAGCRLHYDGDTRSTAGFYNDGDDLYVSLTTRSRQCQISILRSSLTLWFDPDGGRKEVLGIRFPSRSRQAMRPRGPERGNGGPPDSAPEPLDGAPRDPGMTMAENMLGAVDILGPAEGQFRTMTLEDARLLERIQVKAEQASDLMVFEWRISLDHITGDRRDSPIGVGFKVESTAPGRSGGGPGGGKPPGAPGGAMQGGGPGMGGGKGPGKSPGSSARESMEFWVKVNLAAGGD